MAGGKLIVIEGLDGSGKATQTKMLCERLANLGKDFCKLSFPNYESPSSSLVKMYLNGQLGENPQDVNAYAASAFYAVDRAAAFLQGLGEKYKSGALMIADRYTTSNAVYQLSKLPRSEWDAYLEWLCDFEYNRLALPKPDVVLYLDVEPSVSQKLMSARYGGDETRKDIHEKNLNFLSECRRSALYCADKLGWKIIKCSDGAEMRTPQDISREIFETLKGI